MVPSVRRAGRTTHRVYKRRRDAAVSPMTLSLARVWQTVARRLLNQPALEQHDPGVGAVDRLFADASGDYRALDRLEGLPFCACQVDGVVGYGDYVDSGVDRQLYRCLKAVTLLDRA